MSGDGCTSTRRSPFVWKLFCKYNNLLKDLNSNLRISYLLPRTDFVFFFSTLFLFFSKKKKKSRVFFLFGGGGGWGPSRAGPTALTASVVAWGEAPPAPSHVLARLS